MRERNNQNMGFLVVQDCCAPDEGLAEIIDLDEDTGIHLYGLRPQFDSPSF
ncbi:MAG: hypothetical protein ACTSR9_13965 [Candidatus Thorarchaeota archaeon]